MAYRGEPHAGPSCYRHDASPASSQCASCQRHICSQCELFDGTRPSCPDCATAHRQRRRKHRLILAGTLVALIAGGLGLVAAAVPRVRPTHVFGMLPSQIETLRGELNRLDAALARQPCDRRTIVELSEGRLRLGEPAAALSDLDSFVQKCGDFRPLHYLRHLAHEALGQHAVAIAEATAWMGEYPKDKDYPWWRGDAYRNSGDLTHAAADYRLALTMQPGRRGVADDLAQVEAALANR